MKELMLREMLFELNMLPILGLKGCSRTSGTRPNHICKIILRGELGSSCLRRLGKLAHFCTLLSDTNAKIEPWPIIHGIQKAHNKPVVASCLGQDKSSVTMARSGSPEKGDCSSYLVQPYHRCTRVMMWFRNALKWSLSKSKLSTEHSQGKKCIFNWVGEDQTPPSSLPAPLSKRRPVLWDAGRSLVAGRVPVGPVGNA